MSKISFNKVLAAVVLLGMVAGTAFVLGSCGKEKANGNAEKAVANTLPNQGETLLEKMTRIYENLYGETVAFHSAEIVEQDNGYTVVIAKAQIGDNFLKIGIPAEISDDGTVTLSDSPETMCECLGCEYGCEPYQLGNSVWDCTKCGNSHDDCDKTIIGPTPGGGGTPQN